MSATNLIITGIIMGTLHVLTGPDHLSALMTLSATDLGGSRSKRDGIDERDSMIPRHCDCRAFFLGVRWGIGHSVGLLVVGGILIAIQEGTTSGEWIGLNTSATTMLEVFVGLFMLGLGFYGAIKALGNRGSLVGMKERAPSKNKRSAKRSIRVITGSEATAKMGNKSNMKNRVVVKNNLVLTGGGEQPVRKSNRDSLFDKMSLVLDNERKGEAHINALWHESNPDGKSSTADSDSRLWNSAKAFNDSLMEYASDDDQSCGMKSRADSVVTIPMGSFVLGDLRRLFNEAEQDELDHSDLGESDINLDWVEDDAEADFSGVDFFVPTATGIKEKSPKESDIAHETRHRGKCYFCSPGLLALLMGIVHGVAGPGGVLGVIPAVEMQDPELAITYLGTFCITSTLVMGGFAAFYRRVCYFMAENDSGEKDKSARLNRVFLIEFGSACLSIFVGIIWLTLLAVGELDEVFP